MPRLRRLHLPNAGFHITARTQNGAPLFTPDIRTSIARDIEEAVPSFEHVLLAHVVMPNHFHIVLKQGHSPLAWVMQRIMQRAVVHVRRTHGGEGHVFGRPYWSCVCSNPAYLRRAIVYTHLNPVKAGLCETPENYQWSTHASYTAAGRTTPWVPREGLMLFADTSLELAEQRRNYQRFIDYCTCQRANRIPGDWLLPEGPQRMQIPSAAHGDAHWAASYSAFMETTAFTRVNVDVARPAAVFLMRIDPEITLDVVRFTRGSNAVARIRRQLIEALLMHGCRTVAIARYLIVTPSFVSRIGREMRVLARGTQ